MRKRRKIISRIEFDLSDLTYLEVYCEIQKLKDKDQLTSFEKAYLSALESRFFEDMEKERTA
jgi:hypothetical protein